MQLIREKTLLESNSGKVEISAETRVVTPTLINHGRLIHKDTLCVDNRHKIIEKSLKY
jgi:hypothetical protein